MRPPTATRFAAATTAAAATLALSACVTVEPSRSGPSATSWTEPVGPAPTSPSTPGAPSSASPSASALPDAATLVSTAQDVLRATKRLTYRQDHTEKGQTVTVTTRGSVDGEPVEQTRIDPTEGTATYRHVGSQLYIKGDARNWAGDAYASAHFVDRWVRTLPGKKAQRIIAGMSMKPDIKDLLDDDGFMSAYLSSTATVRRASLPGVGDTYLVTGDDGSHLWISADGRNHIVRVADYRFDDGSKGLDVLSGYDDAYSDLTTPTDAVQMPNDYDADDDAPSSSDDSSPHATT